MLFDSAEHQLLGKIDLPGLPSAEQKLLLGNGMFLNFGEIISLAGDYYAVPKKPISLPQDTQEQNQRFLDAFTELSSASPKNVKNNLSIIKGQFESIDKAHQKGESAYQGIQHYKYKLVINSLLNSRFKIIDIFKYSFDHMEENAIITHRIGHRLAMQYALKGFQANEVQQKKKFLLKAYAIEAFACHFLTDRFSAGHLRTPQMALAKKFGLNITMFLSEMMHSEDNLHGLNVVNAKGEYSKIFGDGLIFDDNIAQLKIKQAINICVNEIYKTYTTGNVLKQDSLAYQLLPIPTENNFSPLFYVDKNNGSILYRKDLNDLYSKHYQKLSYYHLPLLIGNYLFGGKKKSEEKARKIFTR